MQKNRKAQRQTPYRDGVACQTWKSMRCEWPACRAPPKFPPSSHPSPRTKSRRLITDRLSSLSLRPFPFRALATKSPASRGAGFWTCRRHRGSLRAVAPARARSMPLRDPMSLQCRGLPLCCHLCSRGVFRFPGGAGSRLRGASADDASPPPVHQRSISGPRLRCRAGTMLQRSLVALCLVQASRSPAACLSRGERQRCTGTAASRRLARPPLDGRSEFQNKTRDGLPMRCN